MSSDPTRDRPDGRSSILPTGTLTFLVTGAAVAAFESASEAVAAAMDVPYGALHTGEAHVRDDGRYTGPAVRRCEYLAELAGEGRTLLSAATALAASPPDGASLRDLGLHRLRDLSSPIRIFELCRGDATEGPPPRSLDAVPNNLPIQLTGFVGRDAELDALRSLLAGHRLVTVTGAGGCGKTRLAAQVAAHTAEHRPDGVWWVDLAAVTDPALVAEAAAASAGVSVEPGLGATRSLTLRLRDRRALVVLDNCEQILDGAAEVADALLRTCPEVTVLTTSREPLGVPGEAVWRLPSLAEDEALTLFVERAGLVRPWFTLDASSESAVRTMCARLDGIPLALELAAAWLRTLTPQQIEAGLDDRFALLVRGPRGAVARQQTLAASIAWSHDLLDEPDRTAFRRLAVFAGGFTLEAARAVSAADMDTLGRLVDKSLVVAEERDGTTRYRMLESIRQYAAERLREAGELDATRDRHLGHYLTFAESAEPELERDADAWRTHLETERDNLRAAIDRGLSADDPEPGRRLVAALPWLWHLNGHGHEGIELLRRAIERAPDDRSVLQARLLTGVALVADTASPLDLEFDASQRALEIATEQGDERLRCLCLALAAVGQLYTDFDASWELALQAAESASSAGDGFVRDAASALRGIVQHLRDRHTEAAPLLHEATEGLVRRHRGVAATAAAFHASGALGTGQIPQAHQLAERAVHLAEPLGDVHRVGATLSVLALVHGVRGELDEGLRLLEPVRCLVEAAEHEVFVPGLATTIGTLHLWRGDLDEAVHWLTREATSTDRGTETYLAARALPLLGEALRHLGRPDEATDVLHQAVRVARHLGMPRAQADAQAQQAHLSTPPTSEQPTHQPPVASERPHSPSPQDARPPSSPTREEPLPPTPPDQRPPSPTPQDQRPPAPATQDERPHSPATRDERPPSPAPRGEPQPPTMADQRSGLPAASEEPLDLPSGRDHQVHLAGAADERPHSPTSRDQGAHAPATRDETPPPGASEQQARLPTDPARAADLHHQALAIRVEHGLRTQWPDSLDALGALMARTERPAEAVRILAAATSARDAMGCPRHPLNRPAHDATLAALRQALGDDAFAEAWAAGTTLSPDEAVAYVRRSRGARTRPSTGWASLTPTELDVVRLVAEGLNNPEIAARLFMSRSTVKTHLSHVYAKLSVSNRTELATLAAPLLPKS
ncbi:LuxR C-terminal-related transcriptional regulator [Spirillospora sp. CA-294931]|uniref:LuxR C-terminal-related transcriptional regulator n=1 Tax=Spirillospora sp. CA-294931 TaxID=3240042 RepID=UPI003D8A7A2D